jgi:hypothetical protein
MLSAFLDCIPFFFLSSLRFSKSESSFTRFALSFLSFSMVSLGYLKKPLFFEHDTRFFRIGFPVALHDAILPLKTLEFLLG